MDTQNPGQSEIPEDIRNYLQGILDDAGMVVPDDMREEMIKELYVRLDNFILSRIVDSLPSEDFETFVKMNEEKKPREEIEKFFTDHVADAQTVMRQAFAEFRELYIGNVAVKRNEPAAGGTDTNRSAN